MGLFVFLDGILLASVQTFHFSGGCEVTTCLPEQERRRPQLDSLPHRHRRTEAAIAFVWPLTRCQAPHHQCIRGWVLGTDSVTLANPRVSLKKAHPPPGLKPHKTLLSDSKPALNSPLLIAMVQIRYFPHLSVWISLTPSYSLHSLLLNLPGIIATT